MIQVFDKLEDFQIKDGHDLNQYGSFIDRYKDLGTFSKHIALHIVLRRESKRNVIRKGTPSGGSSIRDYSLHENKFLRDFSRLFGQLFLKDGGRQSNRLRSLPALTPVEVIGRILNLLSFIFDKSKETKAIDRIKCMGMLGCLLRDHGFYSVIGYIPLVDGLPGLQPVIPAEIEVDDFQGLKALSMKSTHANLCHSFEPFHLIKEPIDKLEEGLHDRIKGIFDRILKTGSHEEFIKEALILVGTVEPFHDKASQPSEPSSAFDWDESPRPKKTNVNTLMSKYQLDCHCHSKANNWRESLIPELMNLVLLMRAE